MFHAPPAVEWVCEEPVHLELIVDNLLPVDLRISELHVELIRFQRPISSVRSPVSPPSSARTLESSNSWAVDQTTQPVIRLEAVRLVLEDPDAEINDLQSDNQKPLVKSLEGTYVIQLNEACLIEAAEHRRLHPRSKLDPHWRRRTNSLSCSLPAKTSHIRLVVSVLPAAEMLTMDFFPNDSNAPWLYRVCGITYRLVDFGGMHVCLRAPIQSLNLDNVSNTTAASNQDQSLTFTRERRLSNSSSCAFSTISNLRSSYNSGIDSLLHFAPPPSESKAEHPTTAIVKTLFVNLPCIRMRPPMPRLCVFPGIVRSAHDFREATEFLPNLTTPSVGRKQRQVQTKLSQSSPPVTTHVQPPRFEPPQPEYWSENVASVVVISLYPYESRWLPLKLFMRDEAITQTVKVPSVIRRLNVLRVLVKATDESEELLRKLQLNPGDIMQCVGLESIHKKFPLPIVNRELDNVFLSEQQNVEEEITPIRATECGLLWLNFKSESIWEAVSKFAINSSDSTQLLDKELSFRFSKTLRLEFEIEYAVEVSSNLFGCPFLSRRVSLGVHLTALSSKHAPILLYYPQLSFRDEPFDDNSDSEEENLDHMDDNESAKPEVICSKTFFNCTLRARLSPSLVPRPVRLLHRQYRVRLEISTRWRTNELVFDDSNIKPSCLRTPWTTLTEQIFNNRASYSPIKTSQPPDLFRMDSTFSPNAVSCIEYPDDSTPKDEPMSQSASAGGLYQHLCLPLDCVGDTLFAGKPMVLINPDMYRLDEVGLPIHAHRRALIHLIESHIEINWQSTLYGRPLPSSEFRASSAELLTKRKVVLPDPRFYRHGRFLLGAHDAELSSAERQNSVIDPKTNRLVLPTPSPWYGTAFSTLGSMAGVLWCHNLHLDISLDISAKSYISGQADRAGLCDECHGQPRRVSRRSIFSRRMTQPWMAHQHSDWQFMLGDSRVDRPSQSQMTDEDELAAVRARRFSVPELHSPHQLKGVNTKLLTSAFVTCVSLLEPLAIMVRGWADKNPFEGMDVTVGSADLADSPGSHLKLCRVWSGPVVYEVHHVTDPDSSATNSDCTELSPPLTEGKDYGFIGNAAGVIGLSLASDTPQPFEQTGSIIFFRPGRFWICGVLGLLKPNFVLPSLDSNDLTCFSLPSVADVETVRFSPHGITVHVSGQR
ncbi:hypothetical protein P879_01303 [Paragonimus westermani]|uniref:Trafficking protein particle complex subunit 9 n=1 Tax=Paragonimus westermani TaxID=34504 RepID=A0A8T0DNE5_9TREM|nr:hypothetical protein P879_01303 [Paragonimus westermani]